MEKLYLEKDVFIERIDRLPLGRFDVIISLNKRVAEASRYISLAKNMRHIYWPGDKPLSKKCLAKLKGKRILLASDISVSGETLNNAGQELSGLDVSTFALSGKADYVLYENPVCIDLKPPSRRFVSLSNQKWTTPFMLALGFLSLVWVLLRTGTNAKRATYPCQKIAIPFALGFLAYLSSLFGLALAIKKFKEFVKKHRYALAGLFGVIALAVSAMHALVDTDNTYAYDPPDGRNAPMGVARGIIPGRVAWAHNPDATSWVKDDGYWWEDSHTNQSVVDNMLQQSVNSVAGQTTLNAAWEAVFKYHNQKRGKGNVGYAAGEKIAIKINCNNTRDSHAQAVNNINPSPQLILALVRQLVVNAGVNPSDITVYDASRYVTDNIYNKVKASYPDVVFVDAFGGDGRLQRAWSDPVIHYSQPTWCGDRVPTCVAEAEYLIDMAILKAHPIAGVTLLGKNHYGTINGLDHDQINPSTHGMDDYHPFVDFMGDNDLGGKTVFFIIDGLYAAFHSDVKPDLWDMAPFNGDWPSSIFTSLDPVALSSVACDFLMAEMGTGFQNYSDHHLHEMALSDNPPSGVFYDPNETGSPLPSLGVHEHWNNATDKQYSRNLGTGNGIALVNLSSSNQLPVANITSPASGVVFAPGESFTISATASDMDGSVALVEFFANGNKIGEDAASPYAITWQTNSTAGYSLTVMATDNEGATSTSPVVNITVSDGNTAPAADAGPDHQIIIPNSSVVLDGSGSYDPEGNQLIYSWTQVSGPNTAQFSDALGASPTVSGLIVGTYTFRLTVNDGVLSAADEVIVAVLSDCVPVNLALNQPAVSSSQEGGYEASFAVDGDFGTRSSTEFSLPQWLKVDLGASHDIESVKLYWEDACADAYYIMVSDTDSDPDPSTWTIISTQSGLPDEARTDELTGLAGSGRYIAMYATSKQHPWGISLFEFEVYSACQSDSGNHPPTADAGPDQTIALTAGCITLDGTASSDPDSDPLSFSWSRLTGISVQLDSPAEAQTRVCFTETGDYRFRLVVTDGHYTATDDVAVKVGAVGESSSVNDTGSTGGGSGGCFVSTVCHNDYELSQKILLAQSLCWR